MRIAVRAGPGHLLLLDLRGSLLQCRMGLHAPVLGCPGSHARASHRGRRACAGCTGAAPTEPFYTLLLTSNGSVDLFTSLMGIWQAEVLAPEAAPETSESAGEMDASNGSGVAPVAAVGGTSEGEGWSTASDDGWEREEASSSSGEARVGLSKCSLHLLLQLLWHAAMSGSGILVCFDQR